MREKILVVYLPIERSQCTCYTVAIGFSGEGEIESKAGRIKYLKNLKAVMNRRDEDIRSKLRTTVAVGRVKI